MTSAKIIADSKNEFGDRITTFILTFPRIILSELNTHRAFSRNSASSRAIPFEKMVKSVEENPFIPIAWQKDHKGMQGVEYLNKEDSSLALQYWLNAKEDAIASAKLLSLSGGVTKQLCNRLLEPFMYHTVICTSTDYENFFELRCPRYESEGYYAGTARSKKEAKAIWGGKGDFPQTDNELDWLKANKGQAEIHMMQLAEFMYDAYNESTPKELKAGEWHIPFGDNLNEDEVDNAFANLNGYSESERISHGDHNETKLKISTARCARVSYTVVGEEDKKDNYENDIKLHDRLLESKHLSPFEHCAQAMNEWEADRILGETNPDTPNGMSRNFKGFIQYRSLID